MSDQSSNPYQPPAADLEAGSHPSDLFWFRVWSVTAIGGTAFAIGAHVVSARKWSVGEWLTAVTIGWCGFFLTQYVFFWWSANSDES